METIHLESGSSQNASVCSDPELRTTREAPVAQGWEGLGDFTGMVLCGGGLEGNGHCSHDFLEAVTCGEATCGSRGLLWFMVPGDVPRPSGEGGAGVWRECSLHLTGRPGVREEDAGARLRFSSFSGLSPLSHELALFMFRVGCPSSVNPL